MRRTKRGQPLDKMKSYTLEPVGFIRSTLKGREEAPRQGPEGAPDAWLEIEPQFAEALLGMEVGHELIVITWLHEARRQHYKLNFSSSQSLTKWHTLQSMYLWSRPCSLPISPRFGAPAVFWLTASACKYWLC